MAGRIRLRALALTVVVVSVSALVAGVAPVSAKTGDAIQRLGGCLAGGGQADVLLVLDTSASLRSTDPGNDRVKAAKFFVDELARSTAASKAHVDVAVAGFADKFRTYRSWQPLAKGTEPIDAALDAFAPRDTGFETDYWLAADGARKYLADKAGNSTDRCQVWVWFSDGKYELDKRDTPAERKDYGVTKPYGPDVQLTSSANVKRVFDAGAADLCRSGGVADQLRAQRIITLAIGLKSTGNADFSLMKNLATGSSGCGATSSGTPGEFILASQIGDLYLAFDKLANTDNPGIEHESPLCQGTVCGPGSHSFVLDASISKVHIVGAADVTNFQTVLVAPDGHRLTLQPHAQSAAGHSKAWTARATRLAPDALEMNLALKPGAGPDGWVGKWRLVFIDTTSSGHGKARSNIRLFGDLRPALTAVDGTPVPTTGVDLTTGEDPALTFALVHGPGEPPVPLNAIKSEVSLDALVEYADGTMDTIRSGMTREQLATAVTAHLPHAKPGSAMLRMTLHVTTVVPGQAGTALEPQSVDVPVTVKAPPQYPTVPGRVSFGTTDQSGTRTAALKVIGSGCAWLSDQSSLSAPAGASALTVRSSAQDQAECRAGTLPLTVNVGKVGPGLASGRLTVMTLPADKSGEPVPVSVRYDLEMRNPRNEQVFVLALVLITLAGLAIPVGLLYLIKWRTAKFPAASLALGSLTGPVTADSSFLTSASIAEQDLRGIVLAGTDRRSINLNGRASVRARMGLGLTEPSYAVVGEVPSISSANPSTTAGGRHARLPLAVQDRWIALLDPADPHRGPVEVVFIVAPAAGKLGALLVDARNRLPGAVEKVRSRLGDAPPAPASSGGDGWGGGSPATTAPAAGGTGYDDGWGSPSAPPSAPTGGLDDW